MEYSSRETTSIELLFCCMQLPPFSGSFINLLVHKNMHFFTEEWQTTCNKKKVIDQKDLFRFLLIQKSALSIRSQYMGWSQLQKYFSCNQTQCICDTLCPWQGHLQSDSQGHKVFQTDDICKFLVQVIYITKLNLTTCTGQRLQTWLQFMEYTADSDRGQT